MELPRIEVQFKDLTVEAEITTTKRTLPTLINYTLNAAQRIFLNYKKLIRLSRLSSAEKKHAKILDGVKGIIRPSRMTLILGPPSSGKSTLLKALSGKLSSSLKMSGRATYNGRNISDFTPQRTCSYVSQHDLHHPEMTVRETLDFARLMLGDTESSEFLKEAFRRGRAERLMETDDSSSNSDGFKGEDSNADDEEEMENGYVTDYILKMLGLEECAEIVVGDEMRRGISGGQKKRVTIGEMLVGLSRCYFMDDISTGLDSSTTFDIVKFLRHMTHLLDLTTAISLLQPQQETFDLFDDIILLCEGKIVCQGPRKDVLQFFESMGFRCPRRKNPADFLQEVISKKDQEQYWIGDPRKYEHVSVEKFAEKYNCHCGHLLLPIEFHSEIRNDITPLGSKYKISKWKVFKACFLREILLTRRNLLVLVFKNIQMAILAVVLMTIFIRTQMHHSSIDDGYRYMGAIFAAVVIVMFNGMTELTMTIKRLPIFYKQRELLFLPGWALAFSTFLLSLPMSLLETGIWTSLSYYGIGFAPSPTRFLRQFLALFSVHQMSTGIFRFIATIGRTQVMANTLGTATLISIYNLAGFVVSKKNIQPWLIWGNWISPLTYGQNAVAVNEFLDDRWNREVIRYGNSTSSYGHIILETRGLFTGAHWYWISVGVLLAYAVLFNIFSLLSLAYLNPPHKRQVSSISSFSSDDNHTSSTKIHDLTVVERSNRSSSSVTLPLQHLILVFSHINYYVDTPPEMKKHGFPEKKLQLLRDVSGVFRPGMLTALMGVTGAGKTTLLDVLAGRKTGGYIEGSIRISGCDKKPAAFSRVTAYCEQTDNHSPCITVYETLQYSAWLRLPSDVESHKRNMFIDEVMDLVEMKPLKNAIVGIPGVDGLSAEQRKRLTIAVELVSSPSLIFLDEPTTGLDARAAAIVMRTLRNTVDTGRTVVCTIHQPSIEIFEAFDELLLMKKGGQLIYGGPLGILSKTMIQYFEAINGVPKFRDDQNPAAWMLEATSSSMETKHNIDFAEIYKQSSMYLKNNELVDRLSNVQPCSLDLDFPTKQDRSFNEQCLACLWKQNMSYWRNPEHNVIRFVITMSISLLFGAVFWNMGTNISTEQDVLNILGVMYGSALFLGFVNTNMVQPIAETERIIFYRERSSGMYSSLPYTIAQVIVEIPYIIAQVLIFSFTVYLMIGFQFTAVKFIWFLVFMFLSLIYLTLFGLMTVALTPSQEIAALFSFLIFIMWNMFSGFFVPRTLIPKWWRWFYWIDPGSWTVYGLMVTQLGDYENLISIPGREDQTVRQFLEGYLGLQQNLLPLILGLNILVIVLFILLSGFGNKLLNFQRR